jgi:hypothetical protein
MRIESSVTSVSWIPSESISGVFKTGFAIGASRFDDPPPEVLGDLDALFATERFGSPTGSRPGSRSTTAGSPAPGTAAAGTSPPPGSAGARSGR